MNKRKIDDFHQRLHSWYAAHGRKDLPWRNTADPYAIYISEIMLQQTQVKTVLERYYFPFLKRFPTLDTLAQAKQEAVLSAWQGLGYYNRAINLHKAAKQAGSALPDSVEKLVALPGIGQNTAHAVAAFAFRQPVAVMEANVKRVVARIFAIENPSSTELWEKATALLNRKEPFDYNQAMMDIGAMVCRKRAPDCAVCPANAICEGKASPHSYPAAKVKKAVPVRRKIISVLRNEEGKYHALPRKSRFLNGLYHFNEEFLSLPPLREKVRMGGAVTPPLTPLPQGEGKFLGHIRQQYSHFTLEAEVRLLEAKATLSKDWYELPRLRKLPFSMAEQKILALLEE